MQGHLVQLPTFKTLKIEDAGGGVVVLTLDRPDVDNAISTTMVAELRDFFRPLGFGEYPFRCIVVTGAGERAFCSGGDRSQRNGMTNEGMREQHALIEEYAFAMANCAVPTIAAVRGVAFSGGCELALSCDFIYASDDASFALTEVTRGAMPGAGGTLHLKSAVGERKAKELILTGRPFDAQQALAWGMVNAVFPPEEVLPQAIATAALIAANAPIAVRMARKSIHYGGQADLRTGLMLASLAYDRTIPTEDRREAAAAAAEHRPPRFVGR